MGKGDFSRKPTYLHKHPFGKKYKNYNGKGKNKKDDSFNESGYPKHVIKYVHMGNIPYINPERQKKKEEKRKEQEEKIKKQGKLEKTIENEQEKK